MGWVVCCMQGMRRGSKGRAEQADGVMHAYALARTQFIRVCIYLVGLGIGKHGVEVARIRYTCVGGV